MNMRVPLSLGEAIGYKTRIIISVSQLQKSLIRLITLWGGSPSLSDFFFVYYKSFRIDCILVTVHCFILISYMFFFNVRIVLLPCILTWRINTYQLLHDVCSESPILLIYFLSDKLSWVSTILFPLLLL